LGKECNLAEEEEDGGEDYDFAHEYGLMAMLETIAVSGKDEPKSS